MEVDTLDYAMGGVLSMECKDRKWRPVIFLSKSLNKTERNYKIHDKKILAVIRGLENWKHLLESAKYKFKVQTDHKNLEYFIKAQKLNQRQAHWILYLLRFDFTLKYVPGTKIGKVNELSRRLDQKVGVEKDNENQVFIKDCWLYSLHEVAIEELEIDIVEKIKKARDKDKEVVKVVEEMKKTGVKVLRGQEWQIKEDLVLKEEKVYVPKNEKLRIEIIWLHHDIPVVRYGGKQKMTELVMRNYWWPEVMRDIGKYVKDCDMCQRMKNRTKMPAGKLKLSKIPEEPQTYLIVDFITKLPVVVGKDTILVVCNRLSKMIYFVTTTEGTSAKGLVRLFRDNVWKLHRLLESIVLDRGLQFVAEIVKKLNSMLGIKTKLSILFHLQTDRQTERINKELEQYLRFFVNYRQKDWLE